MAHGSMVEVIWTEPALQDLDAIADYIAIDKPEAGTQLVFSADIEVANTPSRLQAKNSPDVTVSQSRHGSPGNRAHGSCS
jgi:hypothetical protein